MKNNFTWIFVLIVPCALVWSRPMQPQQGGGGGGGAAPRQGAPGAPAPPEQVISVRITSSVAIGRGKGKHRHYERKQETHPTSLSPTPVTETSSALTARHGEEIDKKTTLIPQPFAGANVEFIKQLHSKKETRGLQSFERIHSFSSDAGPQYFNETDDSVAEPSVESVLEVESNRDKTGESIENIPLARSISLSPSSKNYVQGLTRKPLSERGNNQRLTTVSFNIVHDTPKVTSNYNEPGDTFTSPTRAAPVQSQFYNEPSKFYNEPAKVYSRPSQVYSEPAKFYSEPAKVYSEPAKIYSEPAKIYSEPAKIYSEPAKFYSEPASLHLPAAAGYSPWQHAHSQGPVVTTTPITTANVNVPSSSASTERGEHQPEKNYEVDEKISVLTDGRSHGVQEATTESCRQENCKVGYVVEGRQYRKYRVEERTSDGFIVGEYGVVRHEDGALRGVRYTADGDASPRLIYDALMKFLQLK